VSCARYEHKEEAPELFARLRRPAVASLHLFTTKKPNVRGETYLLAQTVLVSNSSLGVTRRALGLFFFELAVGFSEEGPLASGIEHPKRLVTLRRDDLDFVVSLYPEKMVVFRHVEPFSLSNLCAKLRWKIISDSSTADETALSPC
jgi:hypothetical protein